MGGKSASKRASKDAAQMRADEEARQARITEGTDNINRIFDYGGKGDLLTADAVFDPNAVYYNSDGSVWDANAGGNEANPAAAALPAVFGGGRPLQTITSAKPPSALGQAIAAGTGQAPADLGPSSAEQRFQQMVRDGKLYGASGGFNDKYFSDIADSYTDFATPQLEQQRSDANRQLVFDLARSGKLDSSTRATKGADLQEQYDLGLQEIADNALAQQNDARNSVEDARAALISQVNATGDAAGATNAARARAAALSRPAGDYNQLADMFAGFTNTLSQRQAQERAFQASGGLSRGYTPLTYGARNGSVSVSG